MWKIYSNFMAKKHKIVVLGGGTGTFTVLSGLKNYDVDLTAVVSVADNGGSTGILRDELGVLPPGDIRQCLVALSADGDVLRNLFTYRFSEGSLTGHSFGNIFLSALEKLSGDPISAINEAQRILKVKGRVIPVSSQASNLFAELEDGKVIQGEHAIDNAVGARSPIQRCFLSPPVKANPEALTAIESADLVILGPGDVFTSLVPVLLVDGIRKAIVKSKGKCVFVINLVTKHGQTDGLTAKNLCEVLNSYISPAKISFAIINSAKPQSDILKRYEKQAEYLVQDDLRASELSFKVIRSPLLLTKLISPAKGDRLRRSLVRHDPKKLAMAILSCLRSSAKI